MFDLQNRPCGILQPISSNNIILFFCLYFLTGNLIPHSAGGDIRGEDHSENGQDGDQRGMFGYVQPVICCFFNVSTLDLDAWTNRSALSCPML